MSLGKHLLWRALCVSMGIAMLPLLAVACGGEDGDGVAATADPSASTTAEPLEGELLVFAASSLTDAFNALGEAFSEAHPDVSVTFNFASSSALSTQINEGAPADVFASANNAQMTIVTDAGNAAGPQTFATNLPVVVVPAGSDAVTDFDGLAAPGIRLVLAGPDVPIGAYAREILANAAAAAGGPGASFADDVLANLRSNEANVRAVLTKVELGEADAGIVYSTDAIVLGDSVEVIDIPAEYNVVAEYPIAAVKDAPNAAAAAAWLEFVLSEEGQAILAEFGFGSPDPE